MKGLISSLIILLLVGCSPKLIVPENAKVLGHGGMGIKSLLPEDSYPSLIKAYTLLDGTEGDIQLTKDSILVFWHNRELPQKKGLVSHTVFDSLPSFHYFFKKYRIVTLDSLLSSISKGKIISLDIKTHGLDNYGKHILANQLRQIASKYAGKITLFIETPDNLLINDLASSPKEYSLFYYAGSGESALKKCNEGKIDGISMHFKLVDAATVKKIQSKGCKVMLWGIHNKHDFKKAFSLNADYYQTDKIRFRRK
jgi:glycerophosphoryl diester phosphodiesterase